MSALAVESVTVRFGGRLALESVSFAADEGAVTGLIGPNGAGKTTLFNVVCGLLAPASGIVRLDGRDVTREPTYKRSRLGLARTFQRLELFGLLTAAGNVRVAADSRRRNRKERDLDIDAATAAALDRVGIGHLADVRADALPTGQARLVEIARALVTNPRVLLLDEPASGLDETETEALASLLRSLAADDGMAVVLVEHDVSLVLRTCEQVHVLDVGSVLAQGTPAEIRADARVHAAYLGGVPA